MSGVLLFGGLSSAQEVEGPNDKAKRYHALLLKRPGNPTVFSRFVDAWLDTGNKKNLKGWLEQAAKEGGVPEWRVLAALHEYLGEDEAALGALNEAVKRDEKDASLRLARAKLQAKLLSFEAALQDLEAATADEKLGVEASKLQGIYLARAGRIDEAVKIWKEVIEKFPKDEELREDLIEVELVEGLYDDAIAASQELVKLTKDPYKKALRQLRLGDIQILGNKKEEGLKTYEEIMAATGADTWLEREVLAQVERVFMREDDIQGLRDFFQKLRETYPRRVSVRKALARQMALNGEMDEAIALFREVIKITPGDLGNREEFISFLETNERWKDAREELNNLIKQRDQDPLLWERLAGIEEKLKDTEGLKAALAKVKDLKKDSPEGLISVATLYTQAGLLVEAEALLREGQGTFPDSVEVTESLASFLIQNKKEEEALTIWTAMAKTADREGLLRVARSLTSHGKSEAAFKLLQARMVEFGEDPLILAQFCHLAFSDEEAIMAIPYGLKLVAQSSSPTDLESAIKTAARVIKRAEKQEEILRELESQEDRGIPVRCLIAELYAAQSDSLKAMEILDEAEKADPGLLARFYRVRFDENRGEIEGAIASLRKIIELPEGRKTVHLRRLVGLLERNDDVVAALEAVEDWKRMAPGDQAAWKRRAELLASNGEADQAVLELRRMVGKFGAEEESRALLAAALLEANEHRSAQRIYEQLYEEGEDLTTKLKWVAELAKVAQREGTLDDLLADFERRKRENSQSVAPLLALAEIHQSLNQYAERRTALLEASRRRPNDVKLLQFIADVEMRSGEYDRAVLLLKDAAKRDNSAVSKRKLADLYLKNGEFQAGLRLLGEIPKEANDPRRVEATAISLLMKTEWDLAVNYLADLMGRHEGDWRLRYLYARALKLNGQEEEAFQTYRRLLEVDQVIKGLKPVYDPKGRQAQYWRQRAKADGAMGGWIQLQIFSNLLSNERNYLSNLRRGYSSSSSRSVFNLPGTPEEARMMSFIKASEMTKEFDEDKREAALTSLSVAGVERIDLFRLYLTDRKKLFTKVDKLLKESPDDPRYLQLWIGSHNFAEEDQKKDLARLREILSKATKKDPALATGLVRTMMAQKLIERSEAAEIYVDLIEKTPAGDSRDNLLSSLSSTVLRALMKDTENEFTPLAKKLVAEAVTVEKKPKNTVWINSCLSIALNEGFVEEGIVLLNRVSQWLKEGGSSSSLLANNYRYGAGYSSNRSNSSSLKVPIFPPQKADGLPSVVASEIARKLKTRKEIDNDLSKRRAELLELLKPEEGKETPIVKTPEPLESLRGRTGEILLPILRVLVESALGDEGSLPKFAEAAETSNDRDELSLAAGYLWKEKKHVEAYQILARMRMLTLSRVERKEVDGMLAMVGAELASKEDLEWDSEPAKRAALRLRKQLTGYNDRPALTSVMVKLGLQKEAQKLNASPNRNVRRSSSSSARGSAKGIAGLVTDGRKEEAVRIAAKLLRGYASNRNSRYEENRLMDSLAKLDLTDAVLKKIHPGDSQSVSRRLTFANLALTSGKLDLARPVFESLLKDKPKLMAARTGLFMCLPKEERKYETFLSERDGKVDTDSLLEVMSTLWEKADDQIDETLLMLDLTAGILENLKPSAGKERNLSWVNYYLAQVTRDSYYNGIAIGNLYESRENSNIDAKKTEQFEKAARQVLEGMLKHPQTAEQGFMMLSKAQKNLDLKDEELVTFANEGVRQLIRRQSPDSQQNRSNGLWALYRQNGSSGGSSITGSPGPMDYLLARGDTESLMSEELLALLEKNQPERFKTMMLAKNLTTASPDEGRRLLVEWFASLKKDEKDKDRTTDQILADLVSFTESVLLFDPKPSPWTEALEKELTGLRSTNYSPPGWREVVGRWLRWVVKNKGKEGAADFILRFCEGQIGTREKWPLLAELGYDYLPSHLQRPAYNLAQSLSNFCTVDEALMPVVELSVKHDFGKITQNFQAQNVISQQLLNQQDPEEFVEWVKKTGVFSSPKDGERDPSATLGLLGMIPSLPYNSTDHGKKMQAAIESLELDPFFKPLMLLRYKADKRTKILAELWEPRIDLLQGMMKANNKLAIARVKEWFPNYQSKEAGPKLSEFLKSLQAKQLEEVRKKAEKWLAEGIEIDFNDYEGRKHWAELVQIGQDEPELAGRLVVKSLESVLTNPNYRGGSSSYGGIRANKLDQWGGQFLEQLIQSNQTAGLTNQVIMVDHLFRSDLQEQLIEPSSMGGNLTYYLQNNISGSLAQVKRPKDSPRRSIEIAFLDWSKKLTPQQQSTFVALFLPPLLQNHRVDFEHVAPVTKWAEEELKKTSPIMADALIAIMQTRGALKKSNEEAQKIRDRAKEAVVSILGQLDLSSPLALDFAYRTMASSQTQYLFAGLPQWKWLGSHMKSHANGVRNIALSSSLQSLKHLVGHEFPKKKEAAAFLMKEIDGTLVTPELLLQYRNNTGRGEWVSHLLPLALASGDQELARRLVQQNTRSFRGQLAIILRVSDALDARSAARLAPATTLRYGISNLPAFTSETPAKIAKIVEALPQRDRYRFEVMSASLADTSVKEKLHKVLRPARLQALAARYAAEAPKESGPRWQLMNVFASEDKSRAALIGEFEKVAHQTRLITALALQNESGRNEDGRALVEIIKTWLNSEMKAGRPEVMHEEIGKLVENATGDLGYTLRYLATELTMNLARHLLLESLRNPAKAAELVALSRENIGHRLKVDDRGYDDRKKGVIWADYFVHLLAGETQAWYDRAEKLDENRKKAYAGQFGKSDQYGLEQMVQTDDYRGEGLSKLRITLVSAALRDPLFLKNVLTYYSRLSVLMDATLITREELYQVLDELPEDHPRLAEFHMERAGIMGWREDKVEEAEKLYGKARKLALAQDNKMIVHLSDALHARLLGQKKRISDSWKFGQRVDPKHLPEPDQKWFAKDSKNWKEASLKKPAEPDPKLKEAPKESSKEDVDRTSEDPEKSATPDQPIPPSIKVE